MSSRLRSRNGLSIKVGQLISFLCPHTKLISTRQSTYRSGLSIGERVLRQSTYRYYLYATPLRRSTTMAQLTTRRRSTCGKHTTHTR
jgi:hypothetical protein